MLSKATMELMIFMFSEFAKLGSDLILEANFHEQELDKIHQIARENDYEILTLVLRGDVEILYERYLNRINHEDRHPVHLSTTLDVYEDFKQCVNNLRSEQVRGDTISVNADNFDYLNDADLLDRIDDFIGKTKGDLKCGTK